MPSTPGRLSHEGRPMTSEVLNVENLAVSFAQDGREVRAVKGVSFSVGAGETVALVGESGSGKSVTALSTVALLPDSARVSGSVKFGEREMVGAPEARLRDIRGNDISFIFQEPMTSLNPLHTIEKQIGESLALHQGLKGDKARGFTSSSANSTAFLMASSPPAINPITRPCSMP